METSHDRGRRPAHRQASATLVTAGLALVAIACGLDPGKEAWVPDSAPASKTALVPRAPCALRDPLRLPLYGDLHVHTGHSMDAWVMGTIATPDDAYRFARGEPVELALPGASGEAVQRIRIERPLDHAQVLGAEQRCGKTRLCHFASPM